MSLKISEIFKNSGLNFREFSRILSIVFNYEFEKIFLKLNDEISTFEFHRFNRFLHLYKNNIPFEYLSKSCEFFGRNFFVNKNVLIPRAETEFLIQKALNEAKNFKNPKILDLCTGSGIIAITMFLELKKIGINAKILASDISDKALKVAQKNALNFQADIAFLRSNLFENINENFDIILSNPPYIAKFYKLNENVLKEPYIALFGGENGDEILKKIIQISSKKTKILICEMGYDQKNSLKKELENFGFCAEFYKDYADFDRGFVAKLTCIN